MFFCDITKMRITEMPTLRSQTDKILFLEIRRIVEKGLGTSSLPQVVLISSTKQIRTKSLYMAKKHEKNITRFDQC